MTRAPIVLQRELLETWRSPPLLASMISLPLTVVGVPLMVVWYLLHHASDAAVVVIKDLYELSGDLPAHLIVQAAAQNWLPLFLVMPVFLPILIAAQSVGGERDRHTLEPLLATPVSTLDIVLGKSLAAVLPALLITWISAIVFVGGLDWMVSDPNLPPPLPNADWLFGVLVVAPLLALFGNTLAVVVSTRVTDTRAAQNIAAMSVVPLVGLVVAQIAGSVSLDWSFYVLWALVLLAVDSLLVLLAARLFDRERLLTRV